MYGPGFFGPISIRIWASNVPKTGRLKMTNGLGLAQLKKRQKESPIEARAWRVDFGFNILHATRRNTIQFLIGLINLMSDKPVRLCHVPCKCKAMLYPTVCNFGRTQKKYNN